MALVGHNTGAALLSRALAETIIIGHWLLKEPKEAVLSLVGQHRTQVVKFAHANGFDRDGHSIPIQEVAEALGLGQEEGTVNLADLGKKCGP